MDKDGEILTITGPEFNGCEAPPINPAPVLFEGGEALDRCPQSMVRTWDSWENFQEAWFWKKNYGDWPTGSSLGWQQQSAIFLDAIKIFDAEIDKYGQQRRDDSHSENKRSPF